MMIRAGATALFMAVPQFVLADQTDDLLDAVGVSEVIEIMRAEGIAYGESLAEDMLPGGADAGWRAVIAQIYDPVAMEQSVRDVFRAETANVDLTPMMTFFTSPQGQEIVELEVSARRALIDEDLEDAARERFRVLEAEDDPRVARVTAFIDANDLIESNVAGALNASFQFYQGLADGEALEMSESDMLADIWGQEAETRADTREWLYGYLMMAYEPLSDDTMDAYIEISASDVGGAMNRALFSGFNQMYDAISYALGLAAAQDMIAQEL